MERDKLKRKIIQFVNQLTKGCGQIICFSEYCGANPDISALTKTEAAALAIELVKTNELTFCEDFGNMPGFDTAKVLKLIDQNNEEEIISEYSRALARPDIIAGCFSNEDKSIDHDSISKVSNFVYHMSQERRDEFIENFNTYLVSFI